MLRKFTLISNNICYGPCPDLNDEVEQRLTVSSNGRVWFSGYNYGGIPGKFQSGRKLQLNIGSRKAQHLLGLLEQFFANDYLVVMATDAGEWELSLHGDEIRTYNGSLCEDLLVDNIALSDHIRQVIPIENLFVFDGNIGSEDELF